MKKPISFYGLLSVGILATRLLPHSANFSPVAALLLCMPFLFPTYRYASVAVFISLFISDIFLGFHGTMIYVYGSFALIAFIGHLTMKRSLGIFRFFVPLSSAFLFFGITNFGVWATTQMYTKDLSGLMQSYWMGIPFFKMTLIGDIFFYSLFYGVWKAVYSRRVSSTAQAESPTSEAVLMRITASSD